MTFGISASAIWHPTSPSSATNTSAQFELLHTAFDGSNAVFTSVGDDKQRIMVWAGAMTDAFEQFENDFHARRISLVSNWRSHEELVRIQDVIARQIDPDVEYPEARANREVDGDVAAIWEFETNDEESTGLAAWIQHEVQSGNVEPHGIAILVRMRANEVEEQLAPAFSERGLRLRNEARNVGDISIQDLLGEDLTQICLPLLRLGATNRSPEHWNAALQNMQFLEAVDPADDLRQQQLQARLSDSFANCAGPAGTRPGYRVGKHRRPGRHGFCWCSAPAAGVPGILPATGFRPRIGRLFSVAARMRATADSWPQVLDEFHGLGQIALMTIHKSKGLEFHTMIFYGLDNQTWWSLTPDRTEELNSFFVAFTRAKQRAFFTLCTERGQPVTWIEQLLAPAGLRHVGGDSLLAD